MDEDMQILEGVQRRLRVRLVSETGEVLPPGNFRVYGGAFCPGCAPAHFAAERTEEEWVLTMPGLKPGRVPWCWQVLAAEYATGVEWVLAGGEVTVFPRVASGAGGVDPGELELLATLDKTTLELTVTVGESTAACSMAAGDARACAIAADGSAKLAADSSRLAEAARAGAEAARDGAQVAQAGAEAARGDAQIAQAGAETARDGAQVAQAGAEAAREGALVAQAGAETARCDAQVALAGAEMARDGAQVALAGAEMARDGAQVAQGVAEAARDGAQVAQGVAEAARDDAQVAKAGAEAAQVAAGDAAGVAAGSADAAVVAAAEAKAAAAGAEGAADAVRFDLLPLVLDWLAGWLRGMLGEGHFTVTQGDARVTVVLALETTAAQVEEVKAMAGRVLPRNLEKVIMWADGLPVDYARLEYIETVNTNDSQFIDTGIMATNEISCKIRIAHLEQKTGHVVFAYSNLNKPKLAMMVNSPSGALPVFQYGNQATGYGDYKKALEEGKWYSVENKKNEFFIDGNFIKSLEEEKFETSLPIYLFVGNATKPVGRGLVRCSEFEVWEGETKVAHFIPALLRETKTPCMFDLISKQPKWNLGEGDFTYPGQEMEQTTYSLRDRKYGKWTENGIWRLHCVPEGYSSKAEYAEVHGFKVLIETPRPEVGYWSPVWHEREDCIELEWEEVSDLVISD